MIVKLQFVSASVPTTYKNVKDVYTKGALLCLSFTDSDKILKFPLINVFSVESNYKAE